MTTDRIVQNMEVIGADGVHVGAVDAVANGRIRLAKRGSGEGQHKGHVHFIDLGLVADVEGQRVRLSANAAVAVTFEEERSGKPVRTSRADDPGHAQVIKKREPATGNRFRTHAARSGLGRHREEKALASKLDQLRAMTTVVADTGDLGAVARLKPIDCTTNPTIVLKAIDAPDYRDVVDEALAWGRKQSGDPARIAAATADRLAVSVGVELLRLVPGFVSTEVDANLSFNIGASVARARQIIDAYRQRNVGPERVLIKLASTWEGIRAAEILQSEGVKCNMTLLLNRAQAVASAEAGSFLISPFVGRIYDWHKKSGGRDFTADEDPGVRSVRDIYEYYKSNGIETIIMGASFRNTGQIEALAGCDRLTIAPALMDALASEGGELKRVLAPAAAEPRSLRTAEDGICHWFVSEDAVDIKHPDPEGPMDETTFRWIMNEDAMASEKLAEGIRVFAHDLKTLRGRIAERLQ